MAWKASCFNKWTYEAMASAIHMKRASASFLAIILLVCTQGPTASASPSSFMVIEES